MKRGHAIATALTAVAAAIGGGSFYQVKNNSPQASNHTGTIRQWDQVQDNRVKIQGIEKEIHYIRKEQERNSEKLDDIIRLIYNLRSTRNK